MNVIETESKVIIAEKMKKKYSWEKTRGRIVRNKLNEKSEKNEEKEVMMRKARERKTERKEILET